MANFYPSIFVFFLFVVYGAVILLSIKLSIKQQKNAISSLAFVKGGEAKFLKDNAKSRIEGHIRDINIIHDYMVKNECPNVVKVKQQEIAQAGLKPPQTPGECKELIKGIRQWQQ